MPPREAGHRLLLPARGAQAAPPLGAAAASPSIKACALAPSSTSGRRFNSSTPDVSSTSFTSDSISSAARARSCRQARVKPGYKILGVDKQVQSRSSNIWMTPRVSELRLENSSSVSNPTERIRASIISPCDRFRPLKSRAISRSRRSMILKMSR